MTEIGDFFDDPGLRDRMQTKDVCLRYNNTPPSDIETRKDIIRGLFGSIGDVFEVLAPFQCDYGFNINAGDNVFINHNCIILDGREVTIGDNVLIGPNCGIYAAAHHSEPSKRFTEHRDAPIVIGDDVWIGGNSVILAGVTVGSGSVIGAGSVVNRDIPQNVVAAGNPCRVIRRL